MTKSIAEEVDYLMHQNEVKTHEQLIDILTAQLKMVKKVKKFKDSLPFDEELREDAYYTLVNWSKAELENTMQEDLDAGRFDDVVFMNRVLTYKDKSDKLFGVIE